MFDKVEPRRAALMSIMSALAGVLCYTQDYLRASAMEKIVRKFRLSEDTEGADLEEYRVLIGNDRLQTLLN